MQTVSKHVKETAMVLEECPTTQGPNQYWNEKIIEKFLIF